MSDMQSKPDEGSESFYWYLKTLKEQEQKRGSGNRTDNEQEINILRFIKQLEPTVERLMEICEKSGISLLTASSILENLEKSKGIQFLEYTDSVNQTKIKVVQITENGQKRLEKEMGANLNE